MLLVRTHIDKSSIHGIGLFSNQFISKGTNIWEYNSFMDKILTENEINILKERLDSNIFKEFRTLVSRLENNVYMVYGDNAKFTNHSYFNNISNGIGAGLFTVAKRDIEIGEELTENYLDIYFDEEDIGFLIKE